MDTNAFSIFDVQKIDESTSVGWGWGGGIAFVENDTLENTDYGKRRDLIPRKRRRNRLEIDRKRRFDVVVIIRI